MTSTPPPDERWPDIRARQRTFYDAPSLEDLDALDAQVAFVGMPFDQGTFGRPGARYGPDAVRDARGYSYIGYGGMQFDQQAAGYFDSDRGTELLKGVTMADCGNITVVPSDILDNFQKLTSVVEKIAARGPSR